MGQGVLGRGDTWGCPCASPRSPALVLCPAAFRPWVCALVPAGTAGAGGHLSFLYPFVTFVIKSHSPSAPCFPAAFCVGHGMGPWVLTTPPPWMLNRDPRPITGRRLIKAKQGGRRSFSSAPRTRMGWAGLGSAPVSSHGFPPAPHYAAPRPPPGIVSAAHALSGARVPTLSMTHARGHFPFRACAPRPSSLLPGCSPGGDQ